MKISIAMASFNGAEYIKAQLESYIDQTRQPNELIITDDCSSDGTEAIVRKFAETAPFKVEFYRNRKNLGYCGNFNAALMKTSGDLIFLSDQDDIWFPEKIEHMIAVSERNPQALLVMNDAALTDDELNEVGLTKVGQIRSAGLSMDKFVMGCCIGVRRELLDMCLPIPPGYKAHDSWIVGLADGLNARVIEEVALQYYRRHESNESQVIVNRTKRVTRLEVFKNSVRYVFRADYKSQAQAKLTQAELFADGINQMLEKAPRCYQEDLHALEERVRQQIETTRARMEARSKSFLPRTAAICDLIIRGGYRDTNGLKSIARDILKPD